MQDSSRIIETIVPQPAETPTKLFHSTIVPKSFWLGGLKIDVQIDTSLVRNKSIIGQTDYVNQEIRIDPSATSNQLTEQAYLHELTHWIFYMMNEHKLRNNERIVDLFAHFLYQALTSAERLPAGADGSNAPQPDACPFWEDPEKEARHFFSWIDEKVNSDQKSLFDEGEDDFYAQENEADLARIEWIEEEMERSHNDDETESWAEESEAMARSDEEGWYYGDDD